MKIFLCKIFLKVSGHQQTEAEYSQNRKEIKRIYLRHLSEHEIISFQFHLLLT